MRPNASYLRFALRKLAFVAAGNGCLCGLYPLHDLYLPQHEAAAGHVVILAQRQDEGTGSHKFTCRCSTCGQAFAVREEHGYHYPWAEWRPA